VSAPALQQFQQVPAQRSVVVGFHGRSAFSPGRTGMGWLIQVKDANPS